MSRFVRRASDDSGAAMMSSLLVGAVIMALALVVADVSVSNVRNAGRDRVAVSAFGAAEAGVQQAMAYIRDQGVDGLACSPACAANPWGNEAAPMALSFGSGRSAEVWVEVISPFVATVEATGTYLIHSIGTSGQGPGLRRIDQEVVVEPFQFPMGVYADNISLNGTPQTFQQSVFSENCIGGREKMTFSGTDPYYGIPAAAHSAKYIHEGNGSCNPANEDNIHLLVTGSGSTKTVAPRVCNPAYPNDQDSLGGSLSSTTCYGSPYPQTSHYDATELEKVGGRLPQEVLDALRAKAQSQGNYWKSTSSWTPPNPAVHPDAVVYFDVGANATLNITNQLDGYAVNQTTCSPQRSVIVIVDNATAGTGGLDLQSNANLTGGIFVPNGNFAYRGTATFTGPLNARTITSWNGNATSQLTSCFLQNLPGGLLDVRMGTFREVDR